MKNFIAVLMLFVSICGYGQTWQINELGHNPVTNDHILDYSYIYNSSDLSATIRISPIFDNMILIETSKPFGKFRYNIFKHAITTKAVIKLFDENGNKVWRGSTSVGLGTFNTNRARTFGTIKSDKAWDYLMNNKGYITISYVTLFGNESGVDIVIDCMKN